MKKFENFDFRIVSHGTSLRWMLCDEMNQRYEFLYSSTINILKANIVGCTDHEYCQYIKDGWYRFDAMMELLVGMHILDARKQELVQTNIYAYIQSLTLIIESRKGEK